MLSLSCDSIAKWQFDSLFNEIRRLGWCFLLRHNQLSTQIGNAFFVYFRKALEKDNTISGFRQLRGNVPTSFAFANREARSEANVGLMLRKSFNATFVRINAKRKYAIDLAFLFRLIGLLKLKYNARILEKFQRVLSM